MLPSSLLLNRTWIALPDAFWFKFEVDNQYNVTKDWSWTMMFIDLFDAEIQIAWRYNWSYNSHYFNVFDKDNVNKIWAIVPWTRVHYKVIYYSTWVNAWKVVWYYWWWASWIVIWNSFVDIWTTNRLKYNTIQPSSDFSFWQVTIFNTYIVSEDFSSLNPSSSILFSDTFNSPVINSSKWQFIQTGSPTPPAYRSPWYTFFRDFWGSSIRQIWQITV